MKLRNLSALVLVFLVGMSTVALAAGNSEGAAAAKAAPKPKEPAKPKEAAAKPDPNTPPSNEVMAKIGPNFVPVTGMHLVVTATQGPPFRVIDLDAYAQYDSKEEASKVASQKKAYEQAIRDEAKAHDWKEFRDPANGVELARQIVSKVMDNAVPGTPVKDVYVQSMMLH